MDRVLSGASAARELGTSLPRISRAVRRLELDARLPNGRLALKAPDVERLRAVLGVVPALDGLSAAEVRTLAALARSPLGVRSVRELARRSGQSPTAAGRAVQALREQGLVRDEQRHVASGAARTVGLLHANRRARRWAELAPRLAEVRFPDVPRRDARRVPPRLRHLFWNTAASQLVVADAGPYIARRLLTTMNTDGLAWGAAALGAEDWLQAGRARGLADDQRALAANLARGASS